MRLLLDTHTFVWFVFADPRLSLVAEQLLKDPANTLFLSVATPWEVAIKVSTGKMTLNTQHGLAPFFERQMQQNGINLLPLELKHLTPLPSLPFHHKGPFDRLLIAQAMTEGMPLISIDTAFDAYSVTRFW